MPSTRPAVVFGDIHGEANLFAQAIGIVRERFGTDVDLYHVGDLIDRGPDSKGVIDLCVTNNVRGVLGNHETWLHQVLAEGHFDTFALHKSMAGNKTLHSYGVQTRRPAEVVAELRENMPRVHRDYILGLDIWLKFTMPGRVYRIVHAGLKRSQAESFIGEAERRAARGGSTSDHLCDVVAHLSSASLLWTGPNLKNPNLHHFGDGSCQIFGHTPRRHPTITKRWIAMDTGCGTRPPWMLSAIVLPSREVISVNALTDKVKIEQPFSDFTM